MKSETSPLRIKDKFRKSFPIQKYIPEQDLVTAKGESKGEEAPIPN